MSVPPRRADVERVQHREILAEEVGHRARTKSDARGLSQTRANLEGVLEQVELELQGMLAPWDR
jgi:hypothetical protein